MAQTLSTRRRLLAIIGGGFCGTILRVLLSSLLQGWLGKGWPYDILNINITGAFFLALVTTLADATLLVGPTRRLFINVGLLGAYTTFSTLALGDVLLMADGRWLSALVYLILSGLGGIVAVFLGDLLGQWWVSKVRRPSLPKTTRKLTGLLTPSPLNRTVTQEHVDVQDDVLLPEGEQNREARRPR
jgi:fluoride exporter